MISDYDKGLITYDFVRNLRTKYNGPIFIDTKKTDLRRFEGCFVKINKLEYERAETVCSDLIVTLGADGATYKDNTYSAPSVEVNDVTGAGDTFLAAVTFGYLTTGNIEDAIKLAISASSITVQHLGVYAPSLEEII